MEKIKAVLMENPEQTINMKWEECLMKLKGNIYFQALSPYDQLT